MVGDDIYRDITGALSIGLRTILVTKYSRKNGTICKIKPDLIVESVFDIPNYIRRYVNE